MSLAEFAELFYFEQSGVIFTSEWWNECLTPLD